MKLFHNHALGGLLYLLGFLVAFGIVPFSPVPTNNIVIGALVVLAATYFEFKGRRG